MIKADMRKILDAEIARTYVIIEELKKHVEMLEEVRAEMHNRRPVMRAPAVHKRLTPEIKSRIWDIHREHPDWSQVMIGRVCNVDPGRVSEVLAGKRT